MIIDSNLESSLISISPNFNGNQIENISNDNVYLYSLTEVVANVHSSSFVSHKNNVVYIERVKTAPSKYCNYTAGVVLGHNEELALVKKQNKSIHLNNILFMGGNGAFNYYHWLIEIAPKLLFVKRNFLKDINIDGLVFSSDIKKFKSFQVILDILLKDADIDFPIHIIEQNVDINANNLHYISTVNNTVFNVVGKLSDVAFSHYHVKNLIKMRELIVRSLYVNELNNQSKKIFLARNRNQVRTYNQDEVVEYFQSEGFRIVYLEQFDFKQQVEIFYNADFIIGPSGAAWANIIFCKDGAKAISWLPENMDEFSVFSSLAKIFKCDMHFLLTDAIAGNDIHSNYKVDLNKLIDLYRNIK